LVIFCDPNWSPCQKLQAQAKAADLNHQCPLTRDPTYGPATEVEKARAQVAWTREFVRRRATGNAQPHASLGTSVNNYPSARRKISLIPVCRTRWSTGKSQGIPIRTAN